MTWHLPPITVVVPQLDRWSHGDIINATIAGIALLAFILSYFQTFFALLTAKRNYRESMLQREQSARESLRNYHLMLVQMNRENRIKLYAPLLAWLRGGWYVFNEELISLYPELIGSNSMPRTHAENLDALQNRILTFEFETELDLLGTQEIRNEVEKWRDKYLVASQLLETLKREVRPTEGAEAMDNFDRDYLATKQRLLDWGTELSSGLDNLKRLILLELEVPEFNQSENTGGTSGAQENEN